MPRALASRGRRAFGEFAYRAHYSAKSLVLLNEKVDISKILPENRLGGT